MKALGVSRQAIVGAVFGVGIMAGAVVAPQYLLEASARQAIAVQPPAGAPMSFADLIEKVSPAVVSVNVVSEREVGSLSDMEEFFDRFRGLPGFDDYMEERRREEEDSDEDGDEPRTREARSLGSGFFISEEGYIVTNNHVVEGATEIEIVLEDGSELAAELIGTDPQTDLAVVKVTEGGPFPYVEFETDMNLRKGDWVVALGNPFGLGGTATAGILSADGRDLGNSNPYTDFLQIDASINRGNSGGPTFDLQGRVIGVNTAIFSPTGGSVGIGFAIPADLALDVTNSIIENGRVSRGWLGVTIQDVTEDFAEAQGLEEARGAIVANINDESPALDAGMQRGDIIIGVNGEEVEDATAVTRRVGSLLAGSENEFTVLREGEETVINVTVGERPQNPNASFTPSRDDEPSSPSEEAEEAPLGVTLRPLTPEDRETLGLDDDEPGMIVDSVDSDSPMGEVGLRPGMAMLEINGNAIQSVGDLEAGIEDARERDRTKVLLAIRNGENTLFVSPDIASEDE